MAIVKIINCLDTEYTLARGRIIGQCQGDNKVISNRQIKKVSRVSFPNSVVPEHLTELLDQSKLYLNSSHQDELRDLLYSYRETFAKNEDDILPKYDYLVAILDLCKLGTPHARKNWHPC